MEQSAFSLLLSYTPNLLKGALLTISMSLLGLLLSLAIGMGACFAKRSKHYWLRVPAMIYTTIIRGVPDLVQLFLIFYGGQYLLNAIGNHYGWDYIDLNPYFAGVVTIAIMFGAYMAESFRGAVQAIPKGQIEAAVAYGLKPFTIFWRITRPLMMRYALPALGNNWLVLLKTTALISVIGLNDLVGFANLSAQGTHRPFIFYCAAAVIFLLLTTLSVVIFRWLEKRYSIGFAEAER